MLLDVAQRTDIENVLEHGAFGDVLQMLWAYPSIRDEVWFLHWHRCREPVQLADRALQIRLGNLTAEDIKRSSVDQRVGWARSSSCPLQQLWRVLFDYPDDFIFRRTLIESLLLREPEGWHGPTVIRIIATAMRREADPGQRRKLLELAWKIPQVSPGWIEELKKY